MTINQIARRVYLDNKEITFTTKEFEILNFWLPIPIWSSAKNDFTNVSGEMTLMEI